MSSFRKPCTVLRTAGGHYDDDGMWVPGTSEEFQVWASVQPMNEQEVAQYTHLRPEGASQFSAVKIYSSTALQEETQELPDGTPALEADVLLWRGRRWKVVLCADWQNDVINHFKMIAWEVEPDAATDPEVSP